MSTGVLIDNFSCFCDSLVFLLDWFFHLNHLHLAEKLQAQVVDEGLNLVGHFRGDVLLDFQEGAAKAPAVFSTTGRPSLWSSTTSRRYRYGPGSLEAWPPSEVLRRWSR